MMDKEIWKDTKLDNIECSNYGVIRYKKSKKLIPMFPNTSEDNKKKSYIICVRVKERKKNTSFSVNKLIYETFHNETVTMEYRIINKDGDYTNVRLDNLIKIPMKDIIDAGNNRGENVYNNKIKEKDVLMIKEMVLRDDIQKILYQKKYSKLRPKLARKYDVDSGTINAMCYKVRQEEDGNIIIYESNRWKSVKLSNERIAQIIKEEKLKYINGIHFLINIE